MIKTQILILTLLIQAAFSQSIAVLEIISSNDEIELTIQENKLLTEELRRQATLSLSKNYSVLSREKIASLIPETEGNLTQAIDIGRVIKSDYVTNGSINKLGNVLTLTVELFECENGNLLGYFAGESSDLKGLLETIRSKAPELFAKIKKPESSPVPSIEQVITPAISTNITPEKTGTNTILAVSLDILGAAAVGFGMYQNFVKAENEYKDYKKSPNDDTKYEKVEDAKTIRNISYILGGVLLASGITVHIWF
jgi:TolB-like protein